MNKISFLNKNFLNSKKNNQYKILQILSHVVSLSFFLFISMTTSSCALLAVGAIGAAAGTTAAVAVDPRDSGVILSDNTISTKLQFTFANSYPKNNIYVNSYDGSVLLTGQIDNFQNKRDIEFTAQSTPNVKQVYNYLEIRLPQSFSSSSQDTLITTQLKTKLINIKNLNSNNIKIITTNSVVYLFGIVNQKDAHIIAEAASKINGVTKVITLFQYLNF